VKRFARQKLIIGWRLFMGFHKSTTWATAVTAAVTTPTAAAARRWEETTAQRGN